MSFCPNFAFKFLYNPVRVNVRIQTEFILNHDVQKPDNIFQGTQIKY